MQCHGQGNLPRRFAKATTQGVTWRRMWWILFQFANMRGVQMDCFIIIIIIIHMIVN